MFSKYFSALVLVSLVAACESTGAPKTEVPVVVGESAKSCGNCNDNNPCTTDTCESNVCTHKEVADCVLCKKVMDPAIERQCYDGNACTDDTCVDGVCKFTAVSSCWACNEDSDCDDGNVCTYDECHFDKLGGGCAHWVSPVPTNGENWKKCDDSDPCTGGDVCHGSQCYGTVMSCDDGLPSTLDTCDAQKGCLHVPAKK